MKFRQVVSLLLFACMAVMNAAAVTHEDCGDRLTAVHDNYVLVAGDSVITQVDLLLTRQTSPDFTCIQFDLVFPEGIRPAIDAGGEYGFAGELPSTKRVACPINFLDNLGKTSLYPVFTVVGVNAGAASMIPIDVNPCQLYCLNVKADATAQPGTYQLKAKHLKYVAKGNDAYESEAEQVICTFTVKKQ